ncbi:Importin-11 [Coelomomyces lativittatus]|nr:Importin-11 [Coelomomyces lativittatus]
MDMMDSDPYECIIEEDKDHWEFTEKGCASRLLMEIVRDYPDVSMAYLTPVLQTFTHATSVQRYDEATLVSMVTGLAAIADQLHTLLPFIPFLTHFLIPWSMQSSSPWVHRVICECIKAFVTVNIPRSECHVIYDWLAKAMRFPHPMVQLAVVDALRCALDSWEFEVTLFLPYLEHFMGQLVPLFSIPAFELKMKVTHCMSVMFERIGSHMVPCTSFLLTVLPNLWLQAVKEQENMFQTSVLHLTLKWVESLQAECLQVQSLAAHFIDQACDVRSPSALYLMEDGLQLWHRMLWYATDPSTLLHQKRWLPSLLEQGSEHLKCVLKIVESYVLLDPLGYMTSVGANVMEVLACLLDVPSYQNAFPTQPSPIPTATTTTTTTTSSTMTITHPSPLNSSAPLSFSYSNLRPQASGAIIQTLELILVSFPEMALTWLLDYQIVRRILCGMLMKSDHPLTLVAFLTLLSRICLQVTHLESLFHSNSLTVDIHALVDVWLDLWDQLAHLHQRKLTVLSFTRLLPFMFHSTLMTSTSSRSPTTSPTTSTTVLPLLHRQAISMLTFCAEFLHEVHESPQGDAPIYWALRQDTLEYPDETVPEWLRRQQLLNSKDPVHGTVTLQAIQSALDQLANQLGGHEPLVAMLPKDLVQDLKTFM